MGVKGYYHYFVEGPDDKKIVNTLKSELQLIVPGKVEQFNVVQEKLTKNRIMTLKSGTTVILVFDVDAGNADILMENIRFLRNQKKVVKNVICVTQIQNLEDELVRSCKIKSVLELTKSKSIKDFKRDILRINNLAAKLKECEFDMGQFWILQPDGRFKGISNEAGKIKL